MGEQVKITVGAFAPPLHEQVGVDAAALEHVQADHDAIVRLTVRGYFGEQYTDFLFRRMIAKMQAILKKHGFPKGSNDDAGGCHDD